MNFTDSTYDFIVNSFNPEQRIEAVRFLRAVTRMRDGESLSFKYVQRMLDGMQRGATASIVLSGLPVASSTLIDMAAKGAGINQETAPDRTVRI